MNNDLSEIIEFEDKIIEAKQNKKLTKQEFDNLEDLLVENAMMDAGIPIEDIFS